MPRITGAGGEGVQSVVLALRIHRAPRRMSSGQSASPRSRRRSARPRAASSATCRPSSRRATSSRTPRRSATRIGPRLVSPRAPRRRQLRSRRASPCRRMRDLRDRSATSSVVSAVEQEGMRVLATVPGRRTWRSASSAARSSLPRLGAGQGRAGFRRRDPARPRAALAPRDADPEHHRQPGGPAQGARPRRGAGAGRSAFNESLIGLNALAAPVFDAPGASSARSASSIPSSSSRKSPPREQVRSGGGGSADLGCRLRARSLERGRGCRA